MSRSNCTTIQPHDRRLTTPRPSRRLAPRREKKKRHARHGQSVLGARARVARVASGRSRQKDAIDRRVGEIAIRARRARPTRDRRATDAARPPTKTGFGRITGDFEKFKPYVPAVCEQLKARGAGYVGVKVGVKEDARGSEECGDVDLSPVLEFPSKEAALDFFGSDEYAVVKPLRTENLHFRLAAFEANLLPEGADTSKFGAYLATIKKMNDAETFNAEYPPLMKANNAKFNATMIARHSIDDVIFHENCEDYSFVVLIGFPTYEDAVAYVHDEEFGAKQTAVRTKCTTGPLAVINCTNKTDAQPQYTGVPHDR